MFRASGFGSSAAAPNDVGEPLRRESEKLEQLRPRSRFAEAIDTDDIAVAAHVFPPERARARFEGDRRHAARKHGVAIVGRLAIERCGRWHRHDADANAFGSEQRPHTEREPDFGAGRDDDAPQIALGVRNDVAAAFDRRDAGVVPLSVGGDHSITHPILKAVGRQGPVGMIHIDAHCDTGGAFDQTKFHHGGPFRNAVLDGVLDPTRTIQIGIRGASEYLWEFSYESGMTVIHAEEITGMGIPAIIEKARAIVGDGPTYLSFDIDSLDPAFAPGTGTPEIGGLTTREALDLLRGLKGLNIIGGDVVEVAPQYDATTNTAQAGAQMLFEILSLMVFSPALKAKAR